MRLSILTACASAALFSLPAHAQVFGFGGAAGQVNPDANPVYGTHALSGAPDPYVIGVRTGGDFAARRSGFPRGCYGVVTLEPTVALQIDDTQTALNVFTAGNADTTLAIMAPDGSWRCDDDGARRGTNAALSYQNPMTGIWKVWVGDFDDRQSDALLIASQAPAFSQPFGQPNARPLDPPVQSVELASGFTPNPVLLDVQTGFGIELGSMGLYGEEETGRCSGWIGDVPTAEITWTSAGEPLVFMAEGQADVNIDIVTPSGERICNDDMGDVDERAQVAFSAAEAGTYQVFVGTYMRFDRATNARLSISQSPFPVNEDPW